MNLIITQGTKDAIPAIARLLIKTWSESYRGFLPHAFLDHLDMGRQIKRHQSYFEKGISYLVAENDERELLGFASYGESRFERKDSDLELYTLYVEPILHGKGIGKLLLEEMIHKTQEKFHYLDVSVLSRNPYLKFYLKHGFEKIGEEDIDFGEFVEAGLILRKDLSKNV
ncbi:MAG: GNAT family N-acetyltransferase [Bacteroidia bacterium]